MCGLLLAALQAASNSTVTTTTTVAITTASLLVVGLEVIGAVLGTVLVGSILIRLMVTVARHAGASKAIVNSIRQWIIVLMVVLGVTAVASLTGLSSQLTTLTISGIAGLGVTLALQNTLSNVIAGIFLLEDGVLRIGDNIGFQGVQGEVVKLNLRTTWVKNKDGVIVVIGNSNLAAGPIVNYTAMARLQKKLEV